MEKEAMKEIVRQEAKNYIDDTFSSAIYAYMAGAFPDEPMLKCFEIVAELRKEEINNYK